MDNKKVTDRIRQGISPGQLENFARKHTPEVFSIIALFLGAMSSIFDFFTGPGWSILFCTIGAIVAISFPVPTEQKLKKIYNFSMAHDKVTEMILGGVKIVVAIFLPFIYFGLIGLLAGTSYHYYIRHAEVIRKNSPRDE